MVFLPSYEQVNLVFVYFPQLRIYKLSNSHDPTQPSAAETDPNLVSLALGADLTTLGLNLNSEVGITNSSPVEKEDKQIVLYKKDLYLGLIMPMLGSIETEPKPIL